MSVKLNKEAAVAVAKELTALAIQNGLITKCADSSETAKETMSFFKTIIESLTNDN